MDLRYACLIFELEQIIAARRNELAKWEEAAYTIKKMLRNTETHENKNEKFISAHNDHDNNTSERPTDINQLGKLIVDLSTENMELPEDNPTTKNPDAVALGKLGGLKGGKARANSLTPERRKEIAQKAAATRWGKQSGL